ncbi:hypothetical protein C8Q80DRAFT_410722 [Daedaleopsis nitida]|nr:hypothetical protein C8Q80DRAFT_410722 [Daedaleopsis nitida]
MRNEGRAERRTRTRAPSASQTARTAETAGTAASVKRGDKLPTGVIILVDTSFPCALPYPPSISSALSRSCLVFIISGLLCTRSQLHCTFPVALCRAELPHSGRRVFFVGTVAQLATSSNCPPPVSPTVRQTAILKTPSLRPTASAPASRGYCMELAYQAILPMTLTVLPPSACVNSS